MADSQRSPSSYSYNILRISKTPSVLDVCKAYKFLVRKWHPDKNPTNVTDAEPKLTAINQAYKVHTYVPPPTFSKNASRRAASASSFLSDFMTGLLKNMSRPPSPEELKGGSAGRLSRCGSRRGTTPIVFSHSKMPIKPPPVEKSLMCSLEELCDGCVKEIKITRDVITDDGTMAQEEEILKIKVKPGWRKGTKITFEGKGDKRLGTLPADVIFSIDEKQHPLFRREGDDLEIGVEVPLVQALTGCTVTVPLLGGENMCLTVDDIINPGYEKAIRGQGMPKPTDKDTEISRGDLVLKFLIEFPTFLSQEQRSDVFRILNDCSLCS